MRNLKQDVRPLTDFKRNTTRFLKQMKRTRRPVVLTVNGKAEFVVQDSRSYQVLLNDLDQLEAVSSIRLGMEAVEQGRVRPARKALAELQEKLGIPY